MKIFAILFLIFTPIAHADWDQYAVERADGGISVINYNPASIEPLSHVVAELGFTGRPIKAVNPSVDLPANRSDRNAWVLNDVPIGGKIKVDPVKKQAIADVAQAKEDAANAALQKICPQCSRKEFKDLVRASR